MNSPLQVAARHSISVVTPVYNGEASIAELCRRLSEVLPRIATEYEIILVNDGSRDRSWETYLRVVVTFCDGAWFESDAQLWPA